MRAIQSDRLLTRGADRFFSIRPVRISLASLFSRAPPVLINAYPPTPRRHFITVHANLARSKCQLRERVRQAVLFSLLHVPPRYPSASFIFASDVPRIDRRRRRVLKKRANMEGDREIAEIDKATMRGTRANSPHCDA